MKSIFMKNNKLLIVLILFMQSICFAGFAQCPPPGGDQNLPEDNTPQTDWNTWEEEDIEVQAPIDPNEIIGLEGYNAPESTDTLRWVSATQSLAYTIYFENDAELAMAAASKVTITVPLHEKLNYATFGVGSFGFGSHIFAVEGSPSSYQTRIDLRDSLGIYLDVVAGLDIVHNEAFWIFQSIDPATGLPPTDIHLGFLPINDSLHSGEGFVTCTIKPKAGECVTGDTVSATASIVFDVNEAIPTNTWVNTIDAFAPTSTLTITPNAAGDMLTATFAGEDDEGGCGIKQYKLYYSVNGSAYQLYNVYPVGDTAEIPVETGMEYEFFTLAEDNVGNCEPMKTQPEYNIGTNFVTLAVNAFPLEAGTVTGGGSYSVNDTAQLSATAVEGYHFVNWMSQGVPVSTENPYSAVVSQNQTYTAYFERNAYTLQTLAAVGSSITVVDLNGNEVPSGSTVLHFDQLIISTDTAKCYTMSGLLLNGEAFVSGDTLTVTGDITLSTTTESLLTQTDTTATACDSFVWYGETLTETGDYAKTFTNTNGCDSVVTLHLTIGYSNTGDTTAFACDNFTWYGTTYTETPEVAPTHTFTNALGCDSVVTLHLTVHHTIYGDITATACDSFTWNDSVYTESGDYIQVFPAANGCDSVVTLHLTINNTIVEHIAATACDNYTWNGVTYTESGDYTEVFPGPNDCDFVVVLHLTINTPVTELVEATACDSYTWNDDIYTESGDYIQIFPASNGCDSVVTLHLTINNSVTDFVDVNACNSYTWNESVYTENGDYTQTFFTVNGCDSVVTIHLTIGTPVADSVEVTACDSYMWNDSVYTESGDYTQTFTTVCGCDSVVTLHLTVNTSVADSVEDTACDSYIWNEVTYTESGDYTQTFTAVNGCDSVVTLHLTIHESALIDVYLTIQESDLPYTYGDTTFEPGTVQSGDYVFNLTTADGCDSIIVLHLTVETGVSDHILASDMKVYPNPTTGKLFVEFDEVSMNTQLQVYDIYGKLIMQYTINDRLTELNIGHLANGVYLLRMVDGSSSSKMVKVVKQ